MVNRKSVIALAWGVPQGGTGSNPVHPTSSQFCELFLFTNVILRMVFYVYILQSEGTSKYYCGQTDNLELRLARHNNSEVKSTKHGIPWIIIRSIEVDTRAQSMKLEKEIKGRGISRWLIENQ
jgi:putative endonuclease